jgi:Tfp pilus assembly protein PilW
MKRSNERGFSLIELTIGAMLTVGMMGVIFSLVNRNQQVFLSESGTTDMNENIRTAVDMMTSDVQSAGMGLPRANGSFSAIYYTNGANGAPDKIMIVNGDPYAPDVDITTHDSVNHKFLCVRPSDVNVTGTGGTTAMTYLANGVTRNIYQSYANDARLYVTYDDKLAKVYQISANAQIDGTNQLEIKYNSAVFWSPAATFGSPIDTADPDYPNAKLCMLNSLVAYRLNTATHELERTEDLQNWYAVARGVVDLQIQYFTVAVANPPDPGSLVDAPANRRDIRAVTIKIVAETADLPTTSKNYRRAVMLFQATPRNFNLLNNTNLSNNTESTWDF